MARWLFLLFLAGLFSSCASVTVGGETRIRIEKIGKINKECPSVVGKEVFLKATYLGWNCPRKCKHPRITRSDTCIKDETGCIYLLGRGKLNPLSDRGKVFLFKGKVELSPFSKTCYIKVERVNEVK